MDAIECDQRYCPIFGASDILIVSNPHENDSYCIAEGNYNLPKYQESEYPALNNGEGVFRVEELEVYQVIIVWSIVSIYFDHC